MSMPRNTEEDFWVRVRGKNPDDCWIWTGCILENGYGQTRKNYIKYRAHCLAWRYVNGKVPKGLCVLHNCDVRACCNPYHLFLGGNSKLTWRQVRTIRARYALGETQVLLALYNNVGQSTISSIVRGETWKEP